MNSSSFTLQDINHRTLCAILDSLNQQCIERTATIERRKSKQEVSYEVIIHYHLKEKRK